MADECGRSAVADMLCPSDRCVLKEESLLRLLCRGRGLLCSLLLTGGRLRRSTCTQSTESELSERIRFGLRWLLLGLLLLLLLLLLLVMLNVQWIATTASRLLSCSGLPVATCAVTAIPSCRLLRISAVSRLLLTVARHRHTSHLSSIRVVLLSCCALLCLLLRLTVHATRLLRRLTVARHCTRCLLTVTTVCLVLVLLLWRVHVRLRDGSTVHASHTRHAGHTRHSQHPLHAAHTAHAHHSSHACHTARCHHRVAQCVLSAEHVHNVLRRCCLLRCRRCLSDEWVWVSLATEEVVSAGWSSTRSRRRGG